jgi:hypothetical protein
VAVALQFVLNVSSGAFTAVLTVPGTFFVMDTDVPTGLVVVVDVVIVGVDVGVIVVRGAVSLGFEDVGFVFDFDFDFRFGLGIGCAGEGTGDGADAGEVDVDEDTNVDTSLSPFNVETSRITSSFK